MNRGSKVPVRVGRLATLGIIFAWVAISFIEGPPSSMFIRILVFATAFVAWLFVIMYHTYSVRDDSPWWHSELGRHVMAFVAVDAGIFSFASIATIWPKLAIHPWYMWLYIGSVAGIGWTITWRLLILWRLYHPPEGEEHGSEPDFQQDVVQPDRTD